MKYLPLHIHTDFSNGDALLNVDSYVQWAKENEYPSITVTDHGNLCASLYFNQVASKAGIKSIIGLEAYCAFEREFKSEVKEEKRERDHCVLIAKNYQGYLDLCWLLGQAMRNTFYYKPIILYEELVKYNKNLIVSSACMGGRIPKLVLENKEDEAIEFIEYMKSVFGSDFYIEVMEVEMPDQTAFNQWAINNYKRLGVKIIWTTDTHYLKPEHAEAHDVMKLINTKTSFKDEGWEKRVYKSRNLWLKKREDILDEAKQNGYDLDLVNEFLDNTLEIDSKVEPVKLTRAPEVIMPKFADNSYEILEKKAFDALKARGWDKRPGYIERVKSELEVIKLKRMEDYFLIVADIVNFAENNDVLCGCGRGCFLPGSFVKGEGTMIDIVEIKKSQKVYTHKGRLREVDDIFKYKVENEKMLKIKLANGETLGEGNTIDHEIFVLPKGKEKKLENVVLKQAKDIVIGDCLIKL
jgi:DNA polymerase-3 subunit alpha